MYQNPPQLGHSVESQVGRMTLNFRSTSSSSPSSASKRTKQQSATANRQSIRSTADRFLQPYTSLFGFVGFFNPLGYAAFPNHLRP